MKEDKVKLSDSVIYGIASAIAIADYAARSPKEKNPQIPMEKDADYFNAIAKYGAIDVPKAKPENGNPLFDTKE